VPHGQSPKVAVPSGVVGGYSLGVDVGTTFTAAAAAHAGGCEPLMLGGRSVTVPSVVFIDPSGDMLVGEDAERRGAADPRHLVRAFKRRIGDPTPFLVDSTPWPAEILLANVLQWVLARATAERGAPPRSVTITHPAAWGGFRIERLQEAVARAALPSPRLLSEPAAAATFYASQRPLAVGARVAVYDFGGGTFDAAIVEATAYGYALRGVPQGVDFIGGLNLDEAVFDHVRAAVAGAVDELDANDPVAVADVAELRRQCTQAKEALSIETATSIPVRLARLRTDVRLTRDEFEDAIRPLVKETMPIVRRAAESAGVAIEELACVLLVGGSSRIPLVGQLVAATLGRPITTDANPKLAVALGAALSTEPSVPALPLPVAVQAPVFDLPSTRSPRRPVGVRLLVGAAAAALAVVALGFALTRGGGSPPTDLTAISGTGTSERTTSTTSTTTTTTTSTTTTTLATVGATAPLLGEGSPGVVTGGGSPVPTTVGGGEPSTGGGTPATSPPTTSAPVEPEPVAPDPQLAISPSSGPAGTTVTATVAGFAPGEDIEIYMEADLVAVGSTDQQGRVVLSFVVPAFWSDFPGETVAVDAEGMDSFGYATALFHVS
jgi:molecular chaperone DnaK